MTYRKAVLTSVAFALIFVQLASNAVGQQRRLYNRNPGAGAVPFIGGIFGGLLAAGIAQQAYAYRIAHPQHVRRSPVRPEIEQSDAIARPEQETVLRGYYNCHGGSLDVVSASAEKGMVRKRISSRFVCGNPDQPYAEFVYVGPQAITDDFVTYLNHGRPVHVDHVKLDNAVAADMIAPAIIIDGGEEHWVRRIWNCDGSAVSVAASASSGFVTVRDSVADVCGVQGRPIKEVVYRSSQAFVGTDIVTIKSSNAAPLQLKIEVSAAIKVSATPSVSVPDGSEKNVEAPNLFLSPDLNFGHSKEAIDPAPELPVDVVRNAVKSSKINQDRPEDKFFSSAYLTDYERSTRKDLAPQNCPLEHGGDVGGFSEYQSETDYIVESSTQTINVNGREAVVIVVINTTVNNNVRYKDQLIIALVLEKGMWKIDDIRYKQQGSLRAIFRDIVSSCGPSADSPDTVVRKAIDVDDASRTTRLVFPFALRQYFSDSMNEDYNKSTWLLKKCSGTGWVGSILVGFQNVNKTAVVSTKVVAQDAQKATVLANLDVALSDLHHLPVVETFTLVFTDGRWKIDEIEFGGGAPNTLHGFHRDIIKRCEAR